MKNTIWTNGPFRILEVAETDYDIEILKGDLFNPNLIKEMGYAGTADELRAEELQFEQLVAEQGVFGYTLEKWNPTPGHGWEHVDSCWGFVGQYDSEDTQYNHYIVEELKAQATE